MNLNRRQFMAIAAAIAAGCDQASGQQSSASAPASNPSDATTQQSGVIDAGPDRKNPQASRGLLAAEEIDALVETIHQRSRGESRQATGSS